MLCSSLAWGRSGKEGAGPNPSQHVAVGRGNYTEWESTRLRHLQWVNNGEGPHPCHLLITPPPFTGARPPASPAPCQRVPCPLRCLCVCASRVGAAYMETSPSGTCRTRSSQPSAQAGAPSGESQSRPCPRCLTVQAAGSLTGPAVPSVAAEPSPWLANVSIWCKTYQWLYTTLAGSPR